MFTGLIEATGRIARVESSAAGIGMRVETPLAAELAQGDSIAVNGVCLTVVARDAAGFGVDISPETARVTTLGSATAGRLVNLERPLRADSRLGGHFVLGHVDGVGRLLVDRAEGEFRWLEVGIPSALLPLVISKGSIAIDGISLTVARLDRDRIGVQIVPFTRTHTSLASIQPGDSVNIEVDVLGKYVARLREAPAAPRALSNDGKDGI